MTNRERIIGGLKSLKQQMFNTATVYTVDLKTQTTLMDDAITELEKPDILEHLRGGGEVLDATDGRIYKLEGSDLMDVKSKCCASIGAFNRLVSHRYTIHNPEPVEGSLVWAKAQDGRMHFEGWADDAWVDFKGLVTSTGSIIGEKHYEKCSVDFHSGWSLYQEPELEDGWYWVKDKFAIEEGPRPCYCNGTPGTFTPYDTELMRNPDGTPMRIEIPGGGLKEN